jgi:hypothetical protein
MVRSRPCRSEKSRHVASTAGVESAGMSTIVYGTPTKQCAVHIEQQALCRDLMHGGLIAVKEVSIRAGPTPLLRSRSRGESGTFHLVPLCPIHARHFVRRVHGIDWPLFDD